MIGYLVVDNYVIDELIDTKKIMETIAYFLGIKVVNHRLVKRLEYLSYYDELTGVKNRHSLHDDIEKLSRQDIEIGVIYVDVNGLKYVNDTYGHSAGDKLLCAAANMLQNILGQEKTYREGGDEFVVLLPGISEKQFLMLQQQLENRDAENPGVKIAVGTSWICHSSQINTAIKLADKDMYMDKAKYYQKHDRRRS